MQESQVQRWPKRTLTDFDNVGMSLTVDYSKPERRADVIIKFAKTVVYKTVIWEPYDGAPASYYAEEAVSQFALKLAQRLGSE